jgi:hypothetical protein
MIGEPEGRGICERKKDVGKTKEKILENIQNFIYNKTKDSISFSK